MDKSREPEYNSLKTDNYDTSFWDYYDNKKEFGRFIENGEAYEIYDQNTPRQWFNFLCNDKFASLVTNTGMGFTAYRTFDMRITKYFHKDDYLVRTVNGYRDIVLEDFNSNKKINLLKDCKDLICIQKPGFSIFKGSIEQIVFEVTIFIPNNDTCECWIIKLNNKSDTQKKYKIIVSQTWSFFRPSHENLKSGQIETPDDDTKIIHKNRGVVAISNKKGMTCEQLCGFFFMEGATCCDIQKKTESLKDDLTYTYTDALLMSEIILMPDYDCIQYVTSGACETEQDALAIAEKYKSADAVQAEMTLVGSKWRTIIDSQYCELPSIHIQNFLNVWLKNQLYLTFRYNRFEITGYRDVAQDSWGYMLIDPYRAIERVLEALSKMYPDGRCPRQYDILSDTIDRRDFSDSPLWLPIAINSYIKETGDFSILDKKVGFLDSDEVSTVENHIWRSLDYLYHSRGKHNLILVRGGDWLDGLGGLDKYGPAESAWLTMAAYYAQNLMQEIYRKIGDMNKADMMEQRSAEYKRIVNDVAWDGKWFVYAFTGDGQPIGSSKCKEGKIYLNAQTWAIFTGIVDSQEKVKKMNKSIARYLTTPVGPQLLTPPYVYDGDKLGRLSKQRPGTFANGAIYIHGASFKVYADVASGDYEEAVDTFERIIPNHSDNSHCRRTSEPYCTGNVHFGPNHKRFGQNLYSWFTATPSWLLHAGFEEICGVKAEFDGLRIEPKVPEDWKGYKVSKKYRSTLYDITFERVDEDSNKGIWLDDCRINGNLINSNFQTAKVFVRF